MQMNLGQCPNKDCPKLHLAIGTKRNSADDFVIPNKIFTFQWESNHMHSESKSALEDEEDLQVKSSVTSERAESLSRHSRRRFGSTFGSCCGPRFYLVRIITLDVAANLFHDQ
ncbi:hypothetical protein CEXT_152221 [Caerostris extrusa]|uniref:Uncharacterized protein n=1 Tax=Caerostris extrusa TaxID=172846 RepID=A0AAV4P2H4_CAEEX|nr:hypothetical protein CEXT_152221 [Caerostris extrusa]